MMKKLTTTTMPVTVSSIPSPSALVMHCEKFVPLISKTSSLFNKKQFTPLFFQQLLARQNLTLNLPQTADECLFELNRLIQSTNEYNNTSFKKKFEYEFNISYRSNSLIIFLILIGCVSFISILGNLCLAKVLFTKQNRLTQTDRIVFCLALSELCLVIIDSPTEIYRHLSYSFNQEWLCRFHTFFESLLSSCIIFYHLLAAFDRFVYIHGHASTGTSIWAKWCRRASSKTYSSILLCLPILISLPIAFCNLYHAHIYHNFANLKTCILQYTHPTLIIILITFCILPILLTFFLHGKLIYFIRSRHDQHYLTTAAYLVPLKHSSTLQTQTTINKKRRQQMPTLIREQQLLQPKSIPRTSKRRIVLMNIGDTAGKANTTPGTTINTATGQTGTVNNPTTTATGSSNSSASSRSSTVNSTASLTSPVIFYKVNSQATANANRTLLLLVLLLSFYVLCWAPYNIYTWRHVYQFVYRKNSSSSSSSNQIESPIFNVNELNMTISNKFPSFLSNDTNLDNHQQHETKLRRLILINYSLYLLSMISMCFSFIFYFSLNKQARHQFLRSIRCLCPWMIHCRKDGTKQNHHPIYRQQKQFYLNRHDQKNLYYRPYYDPMAVAAAPPILPASHYQRNKIIKFKNHPMMIPPIKDAQYNFNSTNTKNLVLPNPIGSLCGGGSTKRTIVTYGCNVQCCP